MTPQTSAQPDEAAEHSTVRMVAGRYRVLARIGAGGMGVVWRGFDEKLRRSVALKEVIIPSGMAAVDAANLRERYLREARAAAALQHSNVVGLYDVLEERDSEIAGDPEDTAGDPGRVWIVMELVDAKNLAVLLREHGPLEPKVVAEIGLQLLEALAAAHNAGVLHRDVKPANVMVVGATAGLASTESTPRVVLTDFGVAAITGDPALTRTGQLIGSPVYLAPERLVGTGKAGPHSDLWAVGCTLYAALTGRPPFYRKDHLEVMTAITLEPVPPISNAGLLSPVLAGLLEKDPQLRWDLERTRHALKQVIRGEEVAPESVWGVVPDESPLPTSEVVDEKPSRRGLIAVVGALALAAVVFSAGIATGWFGVNDGNAESSHDPPVSHGPTETFTHPSYGYQFLYPAQWSDTCGRPSICQFVPWNESAIALFVIVEKANTPPPLTAERASKAESNNNSGRLRGYEEIAHEKRKIGDHTGWWLEYVFTGDNDQARRVQVFRISGENGLVYALSLNGDAAQAKEQQQVLMDAISSFDPHQKSATAKTTPTISPKGQP